MLTMLAHCNMVAYLYYFTSNLNIECFIAISSKSHILEIVCAYVLVTLKYVRKLAPTYTVILALL